MNTREIIADRAFPLLKARVLADTGLHYYEDRDDEIADRIGRRLEATGAPDCAAYMELLDRSAAGRDETDALIAEFAIGETYFFRHREQFAALREGVFPELLARNRGRRSLRIWSAGCATGAEPYSVSILLRTQMAGETAGWDISILGTDINRAFLARAAEGSYGKWAFRDGAEAIMDCCFRHEGARWIVRPEFRQGVSFRYHNLVSDPPPSATPEGEGFDLVLCRNVLIYFQRETVHEVASKLYSSLAEGGWLVVGHAEPNTEVFRHFRTEFVAGLTFYRKLTGEPAVSQPAVKPQPQPPHPPGVKARPRPATAAPPPAVEAPRPPQRPAGLAEVRILADRGLWDEAAAECRRLLDTEGLNPAAHFTMALIHEHRGQAGDAERALRAAIYLDRAFAIAHYHLGLLLQKRGAVKEARRAFQNVLDVLVHAQPDEPVPHGDGVSAAELREMAATRLKLLESA